MARNFEKSPNKKKTSEVWYAQQCSAVFSSAQVQWSAVLTSAEQGPAVLNNIQQYSAMFSSAQQYSAVLSNVQQCSSQQCPAVLSNVQQCSAIFSCPVLSNPQHTGPWSKTRVNTKFFICWYPWKTASTSARRLFFAESSRKSRVAIKICHFWNVRVVADHVSNDLRLSFRKTLRMQRLSTYFLFLFN